VIISSTSGVTGNFSGLTNASTLTVGPNTYEINYGTAPGYSEDVTLMVTPEPAGLTLLGLGGLLMLWRRHGRQHRTRQN
jgi:hypothetical protein